MLGQDPLLLAIVALALLFGGFVKGVVAIGLPIVSVGVLSSVMDAHFAIGIIMFPSCSPTSGRCFTPGGRSMWCGVSGR